MISRLRTAETGGADPTQADVTAAAARGRRMRHRRHALAGAGTASVLSLAVIAGLAVLPRDGSTVFQEAVPAVGTDAGPGQENEFGRPAPTKFHILLEALNAGDDWGMLLSEKEGPSVMLDMDSPSARGVPTGDTVRIEIGAEHKPDRTLDCPPPGATENPCELVPASGDRTVRIIRAKSGERVEPEMTEADKAFAANFLTFVREDGLEISIRLIVSSPQTVETNARQGRAQAWMAELDQELITAATDPRLDADPKSANTNDGLLPGTQRSAEPSPPAREDVLREEFARHNRNMERLRAALGEGWALEYTDKPGFPVAATIHLKGDDATARGLPKGAYVWASIGINHRAEATTGCPKPARPGVTCRQRDAADGLPVRLDHATYENNVPSPMVATDAIYVRLDGAVGGVHVNVFVPGKGQLAAGRTWLDRIEDVIVAAATDPAYEVENTAAPVPRETPVRRD